MCKPVSLEFTMVKEEEAAGRESLLEVIDNLIYHVNMERMWFNLLCITSMIIAPMSLFFTIFMMLHPGILRLMFRLDFRLSLIAMAYFIINLFVATLWLIVGLKEFRFLSKWSYRFKRYFSLKEQLDKELQKEFEG